MLITLGAERVTVRVNVSPILEEKAVNRGFECSFLVNNCHHFVLPK